MNNIKKDSKIAILGASLPMLIFAYFLIKKNKYKIDILNESNEIGGAWRTFRYKKYQIRKQSNVVVPTNKYQEKYLKKINHFLRYKLKVKVKKISSKIITKYKIKSKFSYNFDNFIKNLPKKSFKKIKVNELKIDKNNTILINKKFRYDYAIIPSFFGLKRIYYKDQLFDIKYTKVISEHMVAIIKSNKFKDIFYSDFFEKYFKGYFDRTQFIKHKNFTSFSARITKNKKGASKAKLSKILSEVFSKNEIIKLFKFKYTNYFRNKYELNKIMKIKNVQSLTYVETGQLYRSIIQLLNLINRTK